MIVGSAPRSSKLLIGQKRIDFRAAEAFIADIYANAGLEIPEDFDVVNETINVKTETLEQFFTKNSLNCKKYNFWNFDIQGVELQVFRGSKELLKYVDCIYVEVNIGEVYKGCGLMDDMDILLKEYGLVRVMTSMTSANWGDAIYVKV